MSRHSKHSNDRMFFTAKERADAGYAKTRKAAAIVVVWCRDLGSRQEVMGTDCFLPFGFCGLSLKAPKDPVATCESPVNCTRPLEMDVRPEGNIFDKEAILECLLQQKLDIQALAYSRAVLTRGSAEEVRGAGGHLTSFFAGVSEERKKEQRPQAIDKEVGRQEVS